MKIILALMLCSLGQTNLIAPSVIQTEEVAVDVKLTTPGKSSTEQIYIQFTPHEFPILEQMQTLQPLQKVHYSWPLPEEILFGPEDSLVYKYAELTHAVSISARWSPNTYMGQAVKICKKINDTNPAIPVSIGLNYSPYHYFYAEGDPPIGLEDKFEQEFNLAEQRFNLMHQWLANANAALNANVKISAIMLDSERFIVKPDTDPANPEWNQAIKNKYSSIQFMVEALFPNARIEWYGRGAVESCARDEGWCHNSHHPVDMSSSGYSANVTLYSPGDFSLMRQHFIKTVENAEPLGTNIVNCWVSLGSGYQEQNGKKVEKKWNMNWHHDLVNSWRLGAELNNKWYAARPERFAPWDKCQIVIFYPEPFGRTRDWGRHFISYVRGAHTIKTLP